MDGANNTIDWTSDGDLLMTYDPGAQGHILGIAEGSDQTMWFTTDLGNVGRLACDGTYTEFTVRGRPGGLVTTPDGAMWVGEEDGHVIRITSDGRVTDYTLPSPNAIPTTSVQGMVVGPDSAVWFKVADGVGRLTADGSNSELKAAGGWGEILFDSKGDLWVATTDLQHWSAAGQLVATYRLGVMTLGMTVAEDGTLWYAAMSESTSEQHLYVGQIRSGAIQSDGWSNLYAAPWVGGAMITKGSLWFGTVAGLARYTPPQAI
ncbi:MAG TPA: hypothetical protein VFL29_04690 [Candidatus Dormibacteraeota bacterium]|nr:hypothetical protein [Candidatus Dormibacteraeota bacterium]